MNYLDEIFERFFDPKDLCYFVPNCFKWDYEHCNIRLRKCNVYFYDDDDIVDGIVQKSKILKRYSRG